MITYTCYYYRQEDCWTVISSFFEEKGLVRQQLDSFDEFVQNTMQELVDENSNLVLQHVGGDGDVTVKCLRVCVDVAIVLADLFL
ncbi:hypothetical protein MUCCIDRAFT_149592 [Mucor lusitanicus CBS 277.49]|uniref:DNA-directed RNA polymerase n=1 Tax=Mucor lusitanicus CBS 277.49 TaxID=747725 RepID=A0A168HMI6_MUCCL|nr:hypothetical protein MUCCIDRAFT_149592 [Mucor lusitanicus CBS 277.49]